MKQIGSRASRQLVIDAGLAALLAAVAVVNTIDDYSSAGRRVAFVLVSLMATLPLSLRRRRPLASVVTIASALLAMAAFGDPEDRSDLGVAIVIASYSVAAHAPLRAALAGLAAAVAALSAAFRGGPTSDSLGELAMGLAIFAVAPWVVGRVLRDRAEHAEVLRARADLLEREQEARAREAVALERIRVARELHDVVAHSISIIAIQADAAEAALDLDPQRARPALRTVRETARGALGEMRRLLGVLRETDRAFARSPQPGLADLPALVEQTRRAGLPTELTVEGAERVLSPAVDLSAYRIVQESLTNALRHAGPAHARISLRYAPHALELDIADDGRGGATSGLGHGLVGMRERVALFDGEVSAGPRPDGGYRVHAVLPLRDAAG